MASRRFSFVQRPERERDLPLRACVAQCFDLHDQIGLQGFDIGEYQQSGSNGLAIDAEGRLLVCQHGNHRVVRYEKKSPLTVLADIWEGLKVNSPNDLVLKTDSTVYFTDPPYGLPKNYSDPKKEIPYQGVYRIKNGKTELLTTDLGDPI